MNRSTPGLPVQHQLPEFTQTHIHRGGDAIQPFHPLSSPSPPAPNPSQHHIRVFSPRVFSNESTLRMRWPKYWSFSFSIIPSKEIPIRLMQMEMTDMETPSKISQRRQWHPTPVPLPGKSHGQRSLVGCSPWGRKESDTTEQLTLKANKYITLC